jgi:uncharacterized repeat protein (TIGR01451 family)
MKKINTYTRYAVLIAGAVLGLFGLVQAATGGNIDPTDKYAWSTSVGWINFAPTHGGVTVYADHLEGYAWAENVGWIRLGTHTAGGAHTYGNTSSADYGVNVDGSGNLSGYAWSANVGWINFAPTHGGVTIDLDTGSFDGYGWGENVGWIHFKNTGAAAYNVVAVLADLSVAKQADPALVQAGGQLTYTISITNTGGVTLTAAVTDVLPAQVTPSGTLTWTPPSLAPGTIWTQTVVVTAEVGYAGTLTNVVQVTTVEGAAGVYTETAVAVLAGDIYEPDDTCIEANAIPVSGTIQIHSFHDEGDADWVAFEATAGVTCVVEVRVPPTSTADVTLELYDACGAGISDESDPTFSPDIRFSFQPPADGTYYLKLSNTPTTTYGSDVVYHLSVRTLEDNQPSGAVILVAGRLKADDELQANIHNVTNRVYEFALAHGCTTDDIRYLATEMMAGVVLSPTKANLEDAITSWAAGRVGPDQPLTIYLMDHGTHDLLYLDKPSGEWVTPGDLEGWLDSLGAEVPVNVVVEACYSGSFIDLAETVSGPGRVVIASTSNAAVAYATQEGASFSDVFLESLEQGTSLHSAFEEGHWAARQGHPDQQPWLDDDEDGIANEAEDGEVAALRSLACETLAPAENWPPYVKAVAVEGLDGDQGEIQAQVQDDGAVAGVWVVIYPPSYAAPVSGEEMFGEPTPLVLEEHPTEEGWYTRVYTGFDELGEYRLVVHAEDDEAAQGRPKEKTVRTGWPVYLPVLQNH